MPESSAKQIKWYCETQLHYINEFNGLTTDSAHIVSGTDSVDLWCMERMHLGLSLADALYRLEEHNSAYSVFDDMVSLLERIMAISDEKDFKLYCSCPALSDFYMKSEFHWLKRNDQEYKELELQPPSGEWCNWIQPREYLEATKDSSWTGYTGMRNDKRFSQLFERLEKCVITRTIQQE